MKENSLENYRCVCVCVKVCVSVCVCVYTSTFQMKKCILMGATYICLLNKCVHVKMTWYECSLVEG